MSAPQPEWTLICRVEDIPVLGSRRVARKQGLDVAIFRNTEDEVFVLLDRCPHKGRAAEPGHRLRAQRGSPTAHREAETAKAHRG